MFYQYFRPYYCICNIFGVLKPQITTEGKSTPANLLVKIWCLLIAASFISCNCSSITIINFKLKDNLELISDINDLIANIVIMLLNLFNNSNVYVNIHKTSNDIFNDINFECRILKLFAVKMYSWFILPIIMFTILIIAEIVSKYPPYNLLIRIPMVLSMLLLFMHLYVILALLKVINSKLSKILIRNDAIPLEEDLGICANTMYILNPGISFIKSNDHVYFDIKLLCKIYDGLSTSIHLLEQSHGFEILLSIWLIFTNGVVGMTLIVCNQAKIKWLVIIKSILPIFWIFIGCFIDEQIRAEVDQTITLIIKCLIDYRCAPTSKPTLETFKQLVSNDRLQFTACSLFNLSYAMLLGTLLNVITYSIILIQMFLNK